MPPTAQLAGGGPHKLQRTQWHRHPFRLALLQAGGLQLRQLYLGRLWPQPGRQVAPYLPGARGTAAMLSRAIRIEGRLWNGRGEDGRLLSVERRGDHSQMERVTEERLCYQGPWVRCKHGHQPSLLPIALLREGRYI